MSSSKPAISVVVPVYNVEKYLDQCLNSLLEQTFTDFEAILVDDGSIDSSYQICKNFTEKDKRFKAYKKENGGASSARNYGLQRANGEYIYFLDSDDYLDKTALCKMIKCAVENDADLVFIEARTINEKGVSFVGKYDYHKQYLPNDPAVTMEEMIVNKEFHVGTPFFFLKKELFTEKYLKFKEGIMYEDMITAYQFFSLANRCSHVHEHIYTRRYRANSVITSAKTEKNYVSMATVYREVAKFRKTLPEEKQSPKHLIRCGYNVLNIYRQMTPEVRKKYKSDYNEIVKDILDNNAYGDKALELDCKSHLLWGAYKLKKKLFM